MAAASAAVVAIAGLGAGVVFTRDHAPVDRNSAQEQALAGNDESLAGFDPSATFKRNLVPDIATSWSHQSVNDCAAYEPGPSPQVVYVPRFTVECLGKVPFGSTVIFSSTGADRLGGVDWEAASEPWITIHGIEVLRKVRGDEFSISSTYIQGIWTKDPQEYAVYVGEAAVSAMEALSPGREIRDPDGASE